MASLIINNVKPIITCRDTGYTNSCPSGQKLKKNSGRCAYDTSYGTCCKPSGCPSYTSLTSSSYGTNGTDGCEYTCYYTCNMNCPSGTSTSNPGGCGGSTRNGCGTKTCYYPYKACCTPSCSNQYGCSCGTYTVSNGCGGTCTKCSSCCTPKSNETGCSCGTYSCSDGCGGTRKCCSTCSSSGGGGGVTHSCCSNYHDQFGRPWNSSLPTYWVCPEVWPEPNCQCWDGGKCRWKTCEEAGLTTGNPTGTCTRISDYPPNCYRCGASSFIPVIIK